MELTDLDLKILLSAATNAAHDAATHIRKESAGKFEVMHKEGGNTQASQALTEVDLASERIILKSLRKVTEGFELGILTEETEDDASRHTADYFWCIDPIDGTLPFIKGEAGYSVVIALVSREGVPQLGVIWDVVADICYHALRDEGAFRDHRRIDSAQTETPTKLSWFMDRSMVAQSNFEDWKEALTELALAKGLEGIEIIDHAGAALNASWSINAAPAVYFKCPKKEDGGGSVWDFAASACLYAELGLPVSDMSGKPLKLNPGGSTFMNKTGVLYASSPAWVKAVQEIQARLG